MVCECDKQDARDGTIFEDATYKQCLAQRPLLLPRPRLPLMLALDVGRFLDGLAVPKAFEAEIVAREALKDIICSL